MADAQVVSGAPPRVVVKSFHCDADSSSVLITTASLDVDDSILRTTIYTAPNAAFPTASLDGFLGAIGAARAGESGMVRRRANYRILGYLLDQGYLTGTLS